jgi:uncharacterized membrane protein YkvA (DUF1232 family)
VIILKKFYYLRYIFKYLADPSVPFYKKLWILITVLYFFSPFDFIPIFDFLNIFVLFFALLKLSDVLEKYMAGKARPHQAKDGITIENVEYKVHDDD